MLRRVAIGLALSLALLTSCGDDGTSTSASPAGSGPNDASALEFSHNVAVVPSTDQAPACDRFAKQSCATGDECRVSIRREAGAKAFDVYATCAQGAGLALDAACEPWGALEQPQRRSGLSAEVHADPCGAGLICTNTPQEPQQFRCRPSCDLQSGHSCMQGQYCYTGATALQSSCLPSDLCDPTLREGCADGVACYLRPNDEADGLITECLPILTDEPLPDLAPCESTLDCRPGSWCWGPSTRLPGGWSKAEQFCRRTCDASYDDAEVCDPGTVCRELTAAKQVLDFSQVPVPLGQCEQR